MTLLCMACNLKIAKWVRRSTFMSVLLLLLPTTLVCSMSISLPVFRASMVWLFFNSLLQAMCKLTNVKRVSKLLQMTQLSNQLAHVCSNNTFRILKISFDAGYTHLTSGLSRSLRKLVDDLFQLNRVQYLSKGLNLLIILKNIHKDYNQQNATHPCAYGVAVRGFEDIFTSCCLCHSKT